MTGWSFTKTSIITIRQVHLFNDHTIISTLKDLGIYVTQNRIAVLKVLMQCTGAVSVASIRKLSEIKLDRVSVYRTLQAFLDKDLLLVIPNASGIPHYAITKGSPASRNGTAFMICTRCGMSHLLPEQIEVKHPPSISENLKNVKSQYVVLEGLCTKCKP